MGGGAGVTATQGVKIVEQILHEQILQAAEAEVDALTAQLQELAQMGLDAVAQRDEAVSKCTHLKNEIAALCSAVTGGNAVISRQKRFLADALALLNQATCNCGDRLNHTIWSNRVAALNNRVNYDSVPLY